MKNKKGKKAGRTVIWIIVLFLFYTLTGGLLVYYIRPADPGPAVMAKWTTVSGDGEYVSLVEDRRDGYDYRLRMIEDATKSLDVAYYNIDDGVTTRAVLGGLIAAADRGVKVTIVLDGIFAGIKDDLEPFIEICDSHPDMELVYYEPFNVIKPWTFNNRLHDKFIIADGQAYLTGGRNIGDRFLQEGFEKKKAVEDRDIYVKSSREDGSAAQMEEYFRQLKDSPYSAEKKLKGRKKDQAEAERLKKELLEDNRKALVSENIESYDIEKPLIKVSSIKLVHNPIMSLNKKPVILKTLGSYGNDARKIKCQSPYIDLTNMMRYFVADDDLNPRKVTAYTNSIAASPNPAAIAGYEVVRNWMLKKGYTIYEYKGPDSIHGKSFIFDEDISAVGSFNLDNRSSFLSTETVAIIDSPEFASQLNKAMDDIGERSNRAERGFIRSYKAAGLMILGIALYPFRIML